MPTYDYRCERTGEMFEIWQSFSDDALTTCPRHHDGDDDGPVCGAPVKKVFSKVGISFKGDGFYKNDHGANASGRNAERDPSSDTSGSSSESSKGSESSKSAESSKGSESSKSSESSKGSESSKSASTTSPPSSSPAGD